MGRFLEDSIDSATRGFLPAHRVPIGMAQPQPGDRVEHGTAAGHMRSTLARGCESRRGRLWWRAPVFVAAPRISPSSSGFRGQRYSRCPAAGPANETCGWRGDANEYVGKPLQWAGPIRPGSPAGCVNPEPPRLKTSLRHRKLVWYGATPRAGASFVVPLCAPRRA